MRESVDVRRSASLHSAGILVFVSPELPSPDSHLCLSLASRHREQSGDRNTTWVNEEEFQV